MAVSNDFGGSLCALEGRNIDSIELETLSKNIIARGFGLLNAGWIERNVGVALNAIGGVPIGLTVAEKIEAYRGSFLKL